MGVTSRLKTDKNNGKVFFPMNVEGGVEDGFFTPLKLVTTIVYGLILMVDFMSISEAGASKTTWLIHITISILVGQLLLRYILLNEKYYFKNFKKLTMHKVTTPDIFWEVVNVQDTDDGGIIVFSDMKIACIIKLERDTIIGRDSDFREVHYDALSEFFKELNIKEFKWVRMDIMESAEKDDRLKCLDDVVASCSNKNISKLVEMHLGYLKVIARNTLYESEYYMIYTNQSSRIDTIMSDVNECAYKLLDGAYSKFSVLKSEEVYQMPLELYNIKLFNAKSAMLRVFNKTGESREKTFTIKSIILKDDSEIDVKERENLIIEKLASYKKEGKLITGKWTVREALRVNKSNILNNSDRKSVSKVEEKKHDENDEYTSTVVGTLYDSDDNIDDINAVAAQLRNKAGEINKSLVRKKEIKDASIVEDDTLDKDVEQGVTSDITDEELVDNNETDEIQSSNDSEDEEFESIDSSVDNNNENVIEEQNNESVIKEEVNSKEKRKLFGKNKKKDKFKEKRAVKDEFDGKDIADDILKEYENRRN